MNKDSLTSKPYQEPDFLMRKHWYQCLTWGDFVFAIVLILLAIIAYLPIFHGNLDIYEKIIFMMTLPALIALGWFHKPLRWFIVFTILAAYSAVWQYAGRIEAADEKFLLKYLFSSQSAIMWLCALSAMAFLGYLIGAFVPKDKHNSNIFIASAVILSWFATALGMIGLLVRWHESYLLLPDAGHIPVSNLYEVFVLLLIINGLMFLYYAAKHHIERLGVLVYLLQMVLVAFVLWYGLSRGAQEIQPLIPALQSWWMKIHVPANFIGYGGFSIAAMLGVAEVFALRYEAKQPQEAPQPHPFLPTAEYLEEIMYKMIAIGFLFFTIATILGALWAADAWGRYWSWDPKETWALIVWLNYAVWLHMRLVAGWRGKILAWWAVIGLLITAFAFIGVNMFLSGLHSYGSL